MGKVRHTVLCVDDEKNIMNSLQRLLRKENYDVLTADSGAAGLKIMSEREVHLVISDQRMPDMSGVEFLAEVKEKHPDAIRIILSGYTDVSSITEAVNRGHIYKFLLKPWNDENLRVEFRQALNQYDLIQDNRRLHQQVIQRNEELKKINENLEDLIAARTRELAMQNQALELSHAILEDIPVPIVGVGAEGFVALINRRTQSLEGIGVRIRVGDNTQDVFAGEILEAIGKVLSGGESLRIGGLDFAGGRFDLDIHPLSGRFHRKGVIISLQPARPLPGGHAFDSPRRVQVQERTCI
jgi:response regulator RpfG family c-di-GMP phosphodiesterase